MKKITLLLLLINFTIFGQTLEQSYTAEGFNNTTKNYAFLTENSLFYWTIDITNNQVSIYNQNHTLYRNVSVTIPAGFQINQQYFATDKLFNSNSDIEFIIGVENTTTYENKILLFDENGGNSLFDFGDKFNLSVIKDLNNNYKLIAATDKESPNSFDVYALSGTLSVEQEEFFRRLGIISFPNPSENRISITNPINNGNNSILRVYDTNGKNVIIKNVIGNGVNISLDISNLNKGVYTYKIGNYSNKFIKK